MDKKILLITSQDDFSLLANIFLNNSKQDVQCVVAPSISESLKNIEENKNFDLIFLGHKVVKDESLKLLSQSLIPIINEGKTKIYGTNKAFQGKEFAKYYNPFYPIVKIFVDIYYDLSLIKNPNENFLSFPSLSLLDFKTFPFDCYKKEKENYFQAFREGEEVEVGNILLECGEEDKTVYLSRKNINEKIKILNNALKVQLDIDCGDDPVGSFDAATDYTLQILAESGINVPEGAANINFSSFVNAVDISKEFDKKSRLKELVAKPSEFYVKHISLTGLMCQTILKETDLYDRKNIKKLLSASNFQNIFLESYSEYTIYEDEHINSDFSQEAKKRIENHALLAYDLLRKNPLFDTDVLVIIKEQHGDARGIGFPDQMVGKTRLSNVFQIASLFSQMYLMLYEKNPQVNTQAIFDYITDKVQSKDKSILKALRTISAEIA